MPPPHRHDDTVPIDLPGDASVRWRVADLIDLEYYLDGDEQDLRATPGARETLTERDRALYLETIAPAVARAKPHTPRHRRAALRVWLGARRAAEDPELRALLPGVAFDRAQRLVTVGLAVLGFLLGIGLASALLSYDGQRPVNVSWYIFLLVFVQFLLIGGAAALWLLRRTRAVGTAMQDLTLLGRLIRGLLLRVGRWLQRQRLGHAPRDLRDQALAKQGRFKAQYALYGPASYLTVLVPVQVFGVAFNLGVILTTLALEWFTDLAFGWGSALEIGPEAVHGLARLIAMPWSWLFGEGVGYPSLDQVAGSRIVLKDWPYLLDAADLRSWRWFLVLAVLTYGLLPRVLLLAASLIARRQVLARLPLTHGRAQALYARLVTPRLKTPATPSGRGAEMPIPGPSRPRLRPESTPAPASAPPPAAASASDSKPAPIPDAKGKPIAADACLALVHVDVDEILAGPDRDRMAQLLMDRTGWRMADAAPFGSGSALTDQVISWVEARDWEAPPARIAVIMDGSQPPITEHLRFLRELRAAAGTRAQLLLALVGDPLDHDPLPPVSAFDFADWQRKIDQLGDPYLRLEMLAIANAEADG
jgi:hypothetical protein